MRPAGPCAHVYRACIRGARAGARIAFRRGLPPSRHRARGPQGALGGGRYALRRRQRQQPRRSGRLTGTTGPTQDIRSLARLGGTPVPNVRGKSDVEGWPAGHQMSLPPCRRGCNAARRPADLPGAGRRSARIVYEGLCPLFLAMGIRTGTQGMPPMTNDGIPLVPGGAFKICY